MWRTHKDIDEEIAFQLLTIGQFECVVTEQTDGRWCAQLLISDSTIELWFDHYSTEEGAKLAAITKLKQQLGEWLNQTSNLLANQ